MSIRIIHKRTTYGPIHPTSCRLIFSALQISPRASPRLRGLTDTNLLFSEATGQLDEKLVPGLYELDCVDGVQWEDKQDSWKAPKKKEDVEPRSRKQPDEQPNPAALKIYTTPTPTVEKSLDELTMGIEAMLHVIRTIPARYVKYNKILSAQLDSALLEVEALQVALKKMQSASEPQKATGTSERLPMEEPPLPLAGAEETQTAEVSKPTPVIAASRTAKKSQSIPAETLRIFTQYRIFTVLYQVWSAVWTRFGPRSRYYHISDLTNPAAFEAAEHTLNRFHVWRRTFDAQTWAQMKKSSTIGHLVDIAKLARKQGRYVPRIIEIEQPNTSWQYMITPNTRPRRRDVHRLDWVADGKAAVLSVRKTFLDAMLRTKLHRDEELDVVLEQIIDLDCISRLAGRSKLRGEGGHGGESEVDAIKIKNYVRRALRKEFGIRISDSSA
ncbi:uncharacterized protein EV422DRAFT_569779 [Fimicolochytrium jonesii]|uniref:uncharacterized protein n=1 Tax=Fimicolochytrium jonesii TaxID=1396493 RepID=UPI0022FF1DE0|nr:uncharacterized protein EV422DRAFT_569779 [Fimicolochytrium jonesii]KAI8818363.1 hypothetical protein EV422DRAFT_569779 [Fimicolochytrium jonesii]